MRDLIKDCKSSINRLFRETDKLPGLTEQINNKEVMIKAVAAKLEDTVAQLPGISTKCEEL
jgi:hypothetical protein